MRGSGVLMHLSSLPSRFWNRHTGKRGGCFCDFLEETGSGYWQILPIGPTSYGDSRISAFLLMREIRIL